MKRSLWIAGCTIFILNLLVAGCGDESPAGTGGDGVIRYPIVDMETSLGKIVLKLDRDRAPTTVRNFLQYVEDGFYDGLIFHRVVPGLIIKGGEFDENFEPRETRDPIVSEADNGLSNLRGTISMARKIEIDSATSQFFINVEDNPRLDHMDGGIYFPFGYCVFGKIIEGMEVIDAMCEVETTKVGGYWDVPVEPVFIIRAYRKR